MINELITLGAFCDVLNKYHRDFIIYFSTSITDYELNKYIIEDVEKNGGSIILKLTPFLKDEEQKPYSIDDLFESCSESDKNDKIIMSGRKNYWPLLYFVAFLAFMGFCFSCRLSLQPCGQNYLFQVPFSWQEASPLFQF